jgi:hypothetical protein
MNGWRSSRKCLILSVKRLAGSYYDCDDVLQRFEKRLSSHFDCMIPLCGKLLVAKLYPSYVKWCRDAALRNIYRLDYQTAARAFATPLRLAALDTVVNQPGNCDISHVIVCMSVKERMRLFRLSTEESRYVERRICCLGHGNNTRSSGSHILSRNRIASVFSSCVKKKRQGLWWQLNYSMWPMLIWKDVVTVAPSKLTQVVTLLTCVREVLCSNTGWDTDYPEVFFLCFFFSVSVCRCQVISYS